MLVFFECKFEFKKGNIQIVARSLYVDIPTIGITYKTGQKLGYNIVTLQLV